MKELLYRLKRLVLLLICFVAYLLSFQVLVAHVMHASIPTQEFLGGYFGGRRMGGHEVVRKEIAEKQGSDGGASKNSGANRSDGKCDFEEKGAFNVKCKSWDGSSTPKVETAHFVAFGADYRGPKRHPPKHN